MTVVGARFPEAVGYAVALHAEQRRKGGDVPYVAHLLAVAALVLEDGGSEDEAIAGLLHDALEDQGDKTSVQEVARRFGTGVAAVVVGCSDTTVTPKPQWRERKEAHLDSLASADPSVLRVSLADKLHSARAMLRDYRDLGEPLWRRFNAGRDEQLWYLRALADRFAPLGTPAAAEFARVVAELGELVAGAPPGGPDDRPPP